MNILFATNNKSKLKEICAILPSQYSVIGLEEAGISIDILEDGLTFSENALKKAKVIMEMTGRIVLADDSGFEIDYLGKKPGVFSSRFLGESTPYSTKNNYILSLLDGVPWEKRTARFVCAIAAAFPDGTELVTEATFEGFVANESKGENGFGYDPIFFVPEFGMTSAEMKPELKNSVSHRGKALLLMAEKLMQIGNRYDT